MFVVDSMGGGSTWGGVIQKQSILTNTTAVGAPHPDNNAAIVADTDGWEGNATGQAAVPLVKSTDLHTQKLQGFPIHLLESVSSALP